MSKKGGHRSSFNNLNPQAQPQGAQAQPQGAQAQPVQPDEPETQDQQEEEAPPHRRWVYRALKEVEEKQMPVRDTFGNVRTPEPNVERKVLVARAGSAGVPDYKRGDVSNFERIVRCSGEFKEYEVVGVLLADGTATPDGFTSDSASLAPKAGGEGSS